ncbi:hypothetical protein VZO05_11515 [Aggregatilineales bacterium SYSU G02658]
MRAGPLSKGWADEPLCASVVMLTADKLSIAKMNATTEANVFARRLSARRAMSPPLNAISLTIFVIHDKTKFMNYNLIHSTLKNKKIDHLVDF